MIEENTNCIICNNTLTGAQIRYCSDRCKNLRYKKTKKPLNIAEFKKCIICGGDLQNKQRMYCSSKCKIQSKSANNYKAQKQRALNRKIELISMKGGKCESCGYNKNISALCFHHENEKEFKLDARSLANNKFYNLKEEAKTCKLLCHNCHCELHYPDYNDLL